MRAYDRGTGALEATYPITITNPFTGMSAASCAAFGADGKLYVIEPFIGIVRMSLNPANDQSVYAPFVPAGPSLLNDLAFDDAGRPAIRSCRSASTASASTRTTARSTYR